VATGRLRWMRERDGRGSGVEAKDAAKARTGWSSAGPRAASRAYEEVPARQNWTSHTTFDFSWP
jgi:hypothetical protein